jgi:hypothetical protein
MASGEDSSRDRSKINLSAAQVPKNLYLQSSTSASPAVKVPNQRYQAFWRVVDPDAAMRNACSSTASQDDDTEFKATLQTLFPYARLPSPHNSIFD